MLARQNRLPRRLADLVFRRGARASGEFCRMIFVPARDGGARFGFAVPKKFDRRAVARNRVARRLREAVRAEFAAAPGVLGMILWDAENPAAEPDFDALRAEIRGLFARAGEILARGFEPRARPRRKK